METNLKRRKEEVIMNALSTQKKDNTLSQDRYQGQTEERYLSPEVDIYENKEEYLLEAEMPGVSKDGLEVTLEGHVLTLVGRRNTEQPKGTNLVYRESQPWHFRRVFELDPTIDTSKIDARMEQGVLYVRLPKTELVKPRKITVGD